MQLSLFRIKEREREREKEREKERERESSDIPLNNAVGKRVGYQNFSVCGLKSKLLNSFLSISSKLTIC